MPEPRFNPPRHRPGDPLAADEVNAQNDEIRRLGRARGGPRVTVRDGAGGRQIMVNLPEVIFIKLTSSAGTNGAYDFKEVIHSSGNTWEDTGRTGYITNDPAYEVQSGDATLTAGDTVYEARRGCCDGEPCWLFDGKN